MKRTRKSAFTIVELVIVIAVIAILSAVLIPTFGNVIKDATIAADNIEMQALNTELQMYLENETIDSEAELMEVLKDSGLEKRLVTKSMAYGYYYWFHMPTQSFVIGTISEIEAEEPTALVQSDAQLMSAVTIADEGPKYANIYTFREFFGNGYYFVSRTNGDDFGLSDAISFIDDLGDAKDYETLIKYFEYAMKNDADTSAVKIVFDKVKDTTIRTSYGAFFYGGDSVYEYVSPKAVRFVGKSYNYVDGAVETLVKTPVPTSGNYLYIPSNVKYIFSQGLFYQEAGMNVLLPSQAAIVELFCKSSSNIDLTIIAAETGVEYYVKTSNLYYKSNDNRVLGLSDPGLEFSDFYIGYDAVNDGLVTRVAEEGKIPKIYVTYGSGTLQLNAVEPNTEEVSYNVYNWKVESSSKNTANFVGVSYSDSKILNKNTGLLDLSYLDYKTLENGYNVCELLITAKAGSLTKQVKVVVIKPVSASITVGDDNDPVVLNGTTATGPNLDFTGSAASYKLSANVKYTVDPESGRHPFDGLEQNFDLDTSEGKLVSLHYDGNALSFKTNAKGELVCSKDRDGDPYYSLDISVCGVLKTTITGKIVDKSAAPVRFNYKKYNQAGCDPYKLGTVESIKLSDLFSLSLEAQEDATGSAKITIYVAAPVNGKFDPTTEIRKTVADNATEAENPYTLDIIYPNEEPINYSDWNNAAHVIQLQGAVGTNGDFYKDLYIEITPTNGDVSTVAKIDIVDGAINVSKLTDIAVEGKITFTNNVVLHGTTDITTGTTIEIGEGYTLHGNGHVINAEEYTANSTGITEYKPISVDKRVKYCDDSNCPNYGKAWGADGTSGVCYAKIAFVFEIAKHAFKEEGTFSLAQGTSTSHKFTGNESNKEMILLSGGTIDNIYINGPVYPELQYREDESYSDSVSVSTPYYVSGIKTTGNATISNSYVSGFRQPVMAASEAASGQYDTANGTTTIINYTPAKTTTIKDTVLRGGNYANLTVVSGNVTLENVTTIQDYNGMTPTVGDTSKTVYGAGIMLEGTTVPKADVIATAMSCTFAGADNERIPTLLQPLSTKVEIKGYLTQHNWIEKDIGEKDIPIIDFFNTHSIKLKDIFGYFFNGFGLNGVEEVNLGRMGRFMDFIHQDADLSVEANRVSNTYYPYLAKDPNKNKNEMLNLAIMFSDIQQSIDDSVVDENHAKEMIQIDESGRKGGAQFAKVSVQLSHEGMSSMDATMFITGGADISMVIWSCTDGRIWVQEIEHRDMMGLEDLPYHSYYVAGTDWNNVKIVTNSDKYYSPNALYGSDGVYSAWYGKKN